jgi:hypothetical protein
MSNAAADVWVRCSAPFSVLCSAAKQTYSARSATLSRHFTHNNKLNAIKTGPYPGGDPDRAAAVRPSWAPTRLFLEKLI